MLKIADGGPRVGRTEFRSCIGGSILVRVLPIVLMSLGVGLHFAFCEWLVSDAYEFNEPTDDARVIFAHHRRDFEPRRGLPNHLVLQCRPSVDRQQAQFTGVLLPVIMIGIALLIWRYQAADRRQATGYA